MQIKKVFNYSYFSFFRHNVNGGILLIIVALLAMIVANSPWNGYYLDFLNHPISLRFGEFNILSHHGKPLTMAAFINDCLMAIFFFQVGLEIKREILVGELSSVRKASLPILAAIGGMVVPVLVYSIFVQDAIGFRGAAIPMATDIAFSLGVLSLLGKRVPLALKIFLTAFAVVDDIGGILVIAFFYTTSLDINSLLIALGLVAILFIACKFNVQYKIFYIILSIAAWYLFLQSGVHSTIAGVLVAFTIPTKPRLKIGKYLERIKTSIESFNNSKEGNVVLNNEQIQALKNVEAASNRVISPLQFFEDRLHGFVNYFILPLFAFANAGVVLSGSNGKIIGAVTLGVAVGLIVGKPIGIFGFTWVFSKLNIISLPNDVNWKSVLGVSCLGGIGFTVSLFIANLSFGDAHPEILNQAKVGIILGTILSGIIGYILLNKFLPKDGIED